MSETESERNANECPLKLSTRFSFVDWVNKGGCDKDSTCVRDVDGWRGRRRRRGGRRRGSIRKEAAGKEEGELGGDGGFDRQGREEALGMAVLV